MPENQHSTAGLEHYGPPDMRAIETAEIDAARLRVADLLRDVKVGEGYRACAGTALAAILAAVDVLVELGQDQATLSTLQMQASRMAQRVEILTASEPARTLQ